MQNCERPTETTFTSSKSIELNADSEPPTKKLITEVIKALKNNKAPCEDSIIAEKWKNYRIAYRNLEENLGRKANTKKIENYIGPSSSQKR